MIRRGDRHGFTLIETTISVVIVALMLVAALATVGATHRTRRIGYDRPRAELLAHDLMAEILTRDYREPFEVALFGPEGVEAATGRSAFDDIDDYDGWTRSPPEASDGSPLPGLAGWTRAVTVILADPDDLATPSGSGDLGVKAITVTVSRGGRTLATLTTARTESWRVVE